MNSYFGTIPRHRQWPLTYRDLFVPDCEIVDYDKTMLTIGSCFAENILRCLDKYALNIEDPFWGYKYGTHSVLREVRNTLEGRLTGPEQLYLGRSGYTDLNHHRVCGQTREDALKVINAMERNAQRMLPKADILVITLGQNEVWRNLLTGEFILHPYPGVMNLKENLEIHFMSVAENSAQLDEIYSLLMGMNPGLEIILTISPVPLRATFRDEDALVANNKSKFTVYVAASEFSEKHANVHFFPSFDLVHYESVHAPCFEHDCRHVNDHAMVKVMSSFVQSYCTPETRLIMEHINTFETSPVEEAGAALDEIERLGFPADNLLVKRAALAVRRQDTRSALGAFEAVSVREQSPAVLLNIGALLDVSGDAVEARRRYEQALRLLQENPQAILSGVARENHVLFGGNNLFFAENAFDRRAEHFKDMTAFLRSRLDEAGPPLVMDDLLFMESPHRFGGNRVVTRKA